MQNQQNFEEDQEKKQKLLELKLKKQQLRSSIDFYSLETFCQQIKENPGQNLWFKVSEKAVNLMKRWGYMNKDKNKNQKQTRFFLLVKKSYDEPVNGQYRYYRNQQENSDDEEENSYYEGYLEANVIDMRESNNKDFPFDFSGQQYCEKQNYETAFCYERVCIKNFLEFIGQGDNLKEIEMLQKQAEYLKDPRNFVKLASDRDFSYGDGGYCKKLFPVYGCKSLDFPKEQRQKFVEQLLKLGEERQDWHENCPVMDIIDPELNPNYDFQYKQHKFIYDPTQIKEQFQDEQYQTYKSLRSKYAWIPTKFRVNNQNLDTKIMGTIHNLPLDGNQELYKHFEKAFSLMAQGFKNLNLFKNDKDFTDLQVVVKAQRYLIQPKTSYSGKWKN
ncbi:hypothetical protein PPERSA_08711 [Pseudocohnilembus persalinus]|uniref:Uncharacterized protein n=1 Tax=Pseudocohnilembus persalinus TaxID=266149 RepID=A0A0V0QY92_PSEPJ|nr:hypothetical protein PPERSA_08711 [Pseudocohnilembus persalinus]|eukprot:KRX07034.1 hypothetical protein PPERSA_08711 [Pseudocohnilembus persalinus]